MKLRFGIPSLDDLIDVRLPIQQAGAGEPPSVSQKTSCATSIAIVGPDGVGKSIFALHLASRYLADCIAYKLDHCNAEGPVPKVLYISSDFRHDGAQRVWDSFWLHRPNNRQIPFERTENALERLESINLEIELSHVVPFDQSPSNRKAASDFLLEHSSSPSVGFVDLARYTAGDDWNFTNSILAKLGSIPRFETEPDDYYGKESVPHLVIVDSVAGFETYIGDVDAYGVKQSRRARIAQSLRNAGINSHVVFVVEEPKERGTLPEEYVTDVVLRLRAQREGGRTRRTLEVEKARARYHALGEHPFEIRSKNGSSTGEWENPDTPRSQNAYVHVFHALPHRSALVAMEAGKGRARSTNKVSRFGIPHLDRLLEEGELASRDKKKTQNGLRAGSTSGIVGEGSTGKSALAVKFIVEGFRPHLADAIRLYACLNGSLTSERWNKVQEGFERICSSLSAPMLAGNNDKDEPKGELDESLAKADPLKGPRNSTAVVNAISSAWKEGIEASEEALGAVKSTRRDFARLDKRLLAATELRAKVGNPKSRTHVLPAKDCPGFKADIADYVHKIFQHPNLRSPGVLLATGDLNTAGLVDECYTTYLEKGLNEIFEECFGKKPDPSAIALVEKAKRKIEPKLKELLQEQIIVRRFDATAFAAPELFHLVQHNVIEAQRLIHGVAFPPDQARRFPKAGRIRLVIDDLKVLSSLCPDLLHDTSFLPFLTFFLEREGVTSLFVHTESVRPFVIPADPLARLLQPLLQHAIITWGVPFQGQNRVAISVVPPGKEEFSGMVRELQRHPGEEKNSPHSYPWVSRNFELYSGIEQGNPKLIPLSINLYSPTEGFRKYMDQEEEMYRKQFVPVAETRGNQCNRIIWPISVSEYYAIRDLTHLPWDAKAFYTIIDSVDGFWSLDARSGSLSSQREYLMATSQEANEDRFRLFPGKPLNKNQKDDCFQRRYFFENSGYKSRIVDFAEKNDQETPDRVPYMWDFGFILAPVAAWEAARVFPVEVARYEEKGKKKKKNGKRGKGEKKDVGSVLEALLRTNLLPGSPPMGNYQVSWREFFGACKVVAEVAHRQRGDKPVPFDMAGTTAEILASVFMEIWFSEYDREIERLKEDETPRVRWREWCERITNPVYRPADLNVASEFSLRSLLKDGPSSTTTHKELFQNFKDGYEKILSEKIPGITPAAKTPMAERTDEWRHRRLEAARKWEEETIRLGGERRNPAENPLQDSCFTHLNLAALTLYKTWLLLLEVVDFEAMLDPSSPFEMKLPKESSQHAVAARHYYRTACEHQRQQALKGDGIEDSQYILALPGKFVVRGDSFLASPKASRSKLAASYAMDILSSRRANLARLRMGLGLPVRDVLRDDACDQMRTALRGRTEEPSLGDPSGKLPSIGQISYKQLYLLGGPPPSIPAQENPKKDVWPTSWFYRNGIPEYDRISRVLQRWLVRLFKLTVAYKAEHALNWDGGLFAYDALDARRFAPLVNYDSFTYFGELCDYLCAELEAAERVTDSE